MAIVTDEGKKRIIITGSEEFKNYKLLKKKMEKFTFYFDDKIVVCTRAIIGWDPYEGGKVGAEYLGEKWAHSHMYLVKRFHPPDRKGKKERDRDVEIVQYADYMAVFIEEEGNPEIERFIKLAKFHDVKVKEVKF